MSFPPLLWHPCFYLAFECDCSEQLFMPSDRKSLLTFLQYLKCCNKTQYNLSNENNKQSDCLACENLHRQSDCLVIAHK